MRLMLFAPSLLMRERVPVAAPFHRLVSALRTIEALQEMSGKKNFAQVIQEAFFHLFLTPILESAVVAAHKEESEYA